MLDWARLAELKDEVGEEDFAEIAALFLEELGEVIDTLPALAGADERRDALHGVKGAALNLGFVELARLAAQGETAPQAADLPEIARIWAASRAALCDGHPGLAA